MSNQVTPQILIVDDSRMMRTFLQAVFEKKGYAVKTVEDATRALKVMNKGYFPDFILADYQLPGLNGLAFYDRILESPILSEIPFMILSGTTSSHVRIESLEKGAVDYMAKPFNPIELEIRVRRHLPRKLVRFGSPEKQVRVA